MIEVNNTQNSNHLKRAFEMVQNQHLLDPAAFATRETAAIGDEIIDMDELNRLLGEADDCDVRRAHAVSRNLNQSRNDAFERLETALCTPSKASPPLTRNDYPSMEEVMTFAKEDRNPMSRLVTIEPTETVVSVSFDNHPAVLEQNYQIQAHCQAAGDTHMGVSAARTIEPASEPTDMTVGQQNVGKGVWEPLKPIVQVETFRVAPEGYRLGDIDKQQEMVPVAEDVYKGPVVTVIPRPILFWLDSINQMKPADAQLETQTEHGRELLEKVKVALLGERGLKGDATDELESLGYQVSFDRTTQTLLLVMQSGAVRWIAA